MQKRSNKKVKIALVHPVIPSYRVPLLSYLSKFDDIDIVSFHSRGNKYGAQSVGTKLSIKNEKVFALYAPKRAGPFYQHIVGRIAKGGFDVVVCYQSINNISTLMLWQLRKVIGYKFIWWGIGFDPYRQKEPCSKPEGLQNKTFVYTKDWILKRADALLLYSEAGKDYSMRKGIPERKIFILNNTLDVEQMRNEAESISQDEINETRQQLGLKEDSFVFLFLGRLHWRKKAPFLIKAYNQIADELKRSELIIVGDGEEREKVQNMVKTMGLEKRVKLLGAEYDSRRLARLFLASDVVTIAGQVGLAVVHSFVYGKPVVARVSESYSPELDNLTHEFNGILVKDSSLEAYADAMRTIYHDQRLLERLSKGASETADQLTMSRMAETFRKGIMYAVGRN